MKIKIDWTKLAGIAGMVLSVGSMMLSQISQDHKIDKAIDEKVAEKVTEALTKN